MCISSTFILRQNDASTLSCQQRKTGNQMESCFCCLENSNDTSGGSEYSMDLSDTQLFPEFLCPAFRTGNFWAPLGGLLCMCVLMCSCTPPGVSVRACCGCERVQMKTQKVHWHIAQCFLKKGMGKKEMEQLSTLPVTAAYVDHKLPGREVAALTFDLTRSSLKLCSMSSVKLKKQKRKHAERT